MTPTLTLSGALGVVGVLSLLSPHAARLTASAAVASTARSLVLFTSFTNPFGRKPGRSTVRVADRQNARGSATTLSTILQIIVTKACGAVIRARHGYRQNWRRRASGSTPWALLWQALDAAQRVD